MAVMYSSHAIWLLGEPVTTHLRILKLPPGSCGCHVGEECFISCLLFCSTHPSPHPSPDTEPEHNCPLAKPQVEAEYSMREELVLKIAILAEKFAPSVQWCVRRRAAGFGVEWVGNERGACAAHPFPATHRLPMPTLPCHPLPPNATPSMLPTASQRSLPRTACRRTVHAVLQLLEEEGDFARAFAQTQTLIRTLTHAHPNSLLRAAGTWTWCCGCWRRQATL